MDNKWKEAMQLRQPKVGSYTLAPLPNEYAALIAMRKVSSAADLPKETLQLYLQVAELLPGYPVFAFGSRVTGEYVNADDSDAWREVRVRCLGKAWKTESDYDVFIPTSITHLPHLPYGVDLHTRWNVAIATHASVLVNKGEFEWDFSKLPADMHSVAITALRSGNANLLLQLHNTYKLSGNRYCCHLEPIIRWFEWAVATGQIIDNYGAG